MGQENIDYLRDRLSNHEVYIDSEELWKGITAKRRKGFYLKIASLALLLIFIISYFGMQYFNSETSHNYIKTNLVNTGKQDIQDVQNFQGLVLTETPSQENYSKTLDTQRTPSSSDDINHPKSSLAENEVVSGMQGTNNYTGQSLPPIFFEEKKSDLAGSIQAIDTGVNTPNTDHVELSFDTGTERKHNNYIDKIPLLGRSDSELSVARNSIATQIKSMGIDCYDHSGKKMDLYLLGYTAFDFVSPSMTTLPEFKDYLEDRKSSQKQLLGYRAGIQIKYLAENGLYLKAGIEYGVARERFEYRKTAVTDTILPNQLIEVNIDLNGDTTLVYGNAPVKIIEMKNWKVGNRYKSIGALLLAGYQVEKGQFIYGIEAGLLYNAWFKFDGMVLDEKLEPLVAKDYFKSNTSYNLLGGLNAGYKLNDLWTISASLDYRGNLQNINSVSNLVDQKNKSVGLSVGLELKI